MPRRRSFNDVLRDAIDDVTAHGFDSKKRIEEWLTALRETAEATFMSERVMDKTLREALASIYKRMVDRGGIVQYHPGLRKFTLENLKPSLRAELDRRIMASADLIRLNREEAIQKTLRRFEGWSTSIPKGGSDVVKKRKEKETIRKGIAGHSFVERRVIIDQGHKLVSSINDLIATDQGAIAGEWKSNWREPGYDYREDHKSRDGEIFLVRDSWAMRKGFVKLAGHKYTDQVESPAELPFCRCRYRFIYHLRSLPREMLTEKGKQALAEARQTLSRMDSDEKSTKREAEYVGPGRLRPDHLQCNECTMFRAPGSCTAVEGDISPAGYCKFFEAAFDDAEPDDVIIKMARQFDRLGYMKGLSKIELEPDRDKWNANYDPDKDTITLEGKFEAKDDAEKLHIMLHEIGHRGQNKDAETYEDFKRRGLNQEQYFLEMANPVHLRDFRCRGHVDNIAEEVFAESYARYVLGLPMPLELHEFWREWVARA